MGQTFGGCEITEGNQETEVLEVTISSPTLVLVSSGPCPRLVEDTGSERTGNLPEVTQLVHGRARTWARICVSPKLTFSSGKAGGTASSLTAQCLALLQVGGPRATSVIASHNIQSPGLSSVPSPHLSPHPVTSGFGYEAACNLALSTFSLLLPAPKGLI